MKEAGRIRIRESLQLAQEFPEPLLHKLVISRHFSYPLKNVVKEDNAGYANWVQFFNGNELVKRDCPKRGLHDLLQILERAQRLAGAPAHPPEPTSKWTIDELIFTTRQEVSEEKWDS